MDYSTILSRLNNPFEQEVFIEHKGQFDDSIKYVISNQGLEIYFSQSDLTYKHIERAKLSEEEREKIIAKDISGKSSIKTNAFKKITCKNIYPNIDIEYSFPENEEGLKCTIILHPDAYPALVRMK